MSNKLKESEIRLLNIIWDNEPLTSRELTVKAEETLGWKRTTTYTVLKWLIERGICENENKVVRALIKRGEAEKEDSKQVAEYVKKRFGGSLPNFITSFVRSEEMTKEDAAEIVRILEQYIDN